MCGLAGCGKSHWISKNIKDEVIVSPDSIRKNIFGHEFFKDAEDFIWAFAKGMSRLLLEQGKSVIIDATNLTEFSRADWIKLAKQYDAKVKIVWLKTSLKECIRRNDKREREVPTNTIINMAMFFEDPKEYEGEIIEIPKGNKKQLDWDRNYYRQQALKMSECYKH